MRRSLSLLGNGVLYLFRAFSEQRQFVENNDTLTACTLVGLSASDLLSHSCSDHADGVGAILFRPSKHRLGQNTSCAYPPRPDVSLLPVFIQIQTHKVPETALQGTDAGEADFLAP